MNRMKLGKIELDPRSAGLAPMAGVADMAFRELCVEYGATYVVSEMVSSKGLTMCDRKSRKLLVLSDKERPAAAQIFGCDPKIMAQSAVSCLDFHPDVIDINMGCPAPKIAGNGGGSALLKSPALAGEIIREVVNAVDLPVTVKIRIGWDKDSINAVEMAKIAEQAGAAAITVHGRTREQMYAPPVDIGTIALVKKSVSIPVIANGDIVDGLSAAKMIEETGCDYLLVGRGALGRPWVFSQISAYLKYEKVLPEPPVSERMRVMIKHIERICDYKGEKVGIKEARKHAAWYIKGMRGAAAYRQQIGMLSSIEQLHELAYKIAVENS
ncbi:MAG: tRNA dihydrouridine synthase DusB [Oscillospiraceae bacterium]|nr:tRNA dihydrouridine synthase DusB [Oscillospiraceae bacterium]